MTALPLTSENRKQLPSIFIWLCVATTKSDVTIKFAGNAPIVPLFFEIQNTKKRHQKPKKIVPFFPSMECSDRRSQPNNRAAHKKFTGISTHDGRWSPQSWKLNKQRQRCASPLSVHSTTTEGASGLGSFNDMRASLDGINSSAEGTAPPKPKPNHHFSTRVPNSPGKFTVQTRTTLSPRLQTRSVSDLSRSDALLSTASATISPITDVPESPLSQRDDVVNIFGDLNNIDECIGLDVTPNRPPTPTCDLHDVPRSASTRNNILSPVPASRVDVTVGLRGSASTMDVEPSRGTEEMSAGGHHLRANSFTPRTPPQKHRCTNAGTIERSASSAALGVQSGQLGAAHEYVALAASNFSIVDPIPLSEDLHKSSCHISGTRSEYTANVQWTSNVYTLPNKANDQGHRCITPETFHDLTMGKYNDLITDVKVIDCRSIEEYSAGHINNAYNVPVSHSKCDRSRCNDSVEEALESIFFPVVPDALTTAIVFYCEYSSHRGPTGAAKLKKLDSDKLKNQKSNFNSPMRHYPQVYVLEGGYKDYFQKFPDDCCPKGYLPESDAQPNRSASHSRSFSYRPIKLEF